MDFSCDPNADFLVKQAEAHAASLIEEAKKQIINLRTDAHDSLSKLHAENSAEQRGHTTLLFMLQERIAAAQKELAALEQDVAKWTKHRDELRNIVQGVLDDVRTS
jgi:ribosome recycling factor